MFIADIVNNKQSFSAFFADWSHCSSIYTIKLWNAATIARANSSTQCQLNLLFPSHLTVLTALRAFAMSLTELWEGDPGIAH